MNSPSLFERRWIAIKGGYCVWTRLRDQKRCFFPCFFSVDEILLKITKGKRSSTAACRQNLPQLKCVHSMHIRELHVYKDFFFKQSMDLHPNSPGIKPLGGIHNEDVSLHSKVVPIIIAAQVNECKNIGNSSRYIETN